MDFLILSFVAGVLTVLAPCVLPLLPVIIGGSVAEKSIMRPIVITLSLAGSIVIFTLLLKVSSLLIDIPQVFWTYFSGGIILVFAFSLLFPIVWAKALHKCGLGKFEQQANKQLYTSSKKSSLFGMVVTGAALGPVFASCSPTYFFVLGTVLPASWFLGILNLMVYALGLALVMFVVAFAGQKMLGRLNNLSNPHGWFKRTLGILFLIVGLGIITGYDKKLEIAILDAGFFDVSKIEQKLLDDKLDGDQQDIQSNSLEKTEPNTQSKKETTTFPFDFPRPAGELIGVENWINTEPIDSLDSLKGKVVAVKFWTYSCINCIRTLDETQTLWEQYQDDDFVLIGVHSPEFVFEKDPESVAREVAEYGLTFPVVQDNEFETWYSFNNRYWPAFYLLDRDGQIRYTHFGEGKYDEKIEAVGALLET